MKQTTNEASRERAIKRITLQGSVVNVGLLIAKFVAGFVGGSAAMIADAVHSFSDFLTDIVVIVFVHLGNKPEDTDHDYGHGKYETLATVLIGMALLVVGIGLCYGGCNKIMAVIGGQTLAQPGWIALGAALLSIGLKEWTYRFTIGAGNRLQSAALIANAWHHRSDALSSIGTAVGIGGAICLGSRWAVLDPIAAVVVSLFIIRTAYKLMDQALGELLERSLPEAVEQEIIALAAAEPLVSSIHHLRTRRIGNQLSIEMHLRLPGQISLYEAHQHVTAIEQRLRQRFGPRTYISIHDEPVKIDGQYVHPQDGALPRGPQPSGSTEEQSPAEKD